MDMKKFIAIFAILLVALPLALAEETTTDDPGITPDSALYGVDKALDSISLALTFDHAKRAEKSLKIAQERLLEVQKMLQEGKDEDAKKAQKEYEQNLDDSTDEADKVSSDGNKDKAAKALEKLAKLQNKREEHQAFVTDVHERMLERMKDNLTEDQYNKLQEIFSKIENKTRDSESLLESRREAVKTKYKALSGKNDTQVDEDFSNFEKALLEARKEREIQQREKAKERVLEVKEKLKNLNVTDFDDDLEIALELLNNTNSSVDLSDEFRMHGNEISAIANMLRQAKQNGTWNETKAKLMRAA